MRGPQTNPLTVAEIALVLTATGVAKGCPAHEGVPLEPLDEDELELVEPDELEEEDDPPELDELADASGAALGTGSSPTHPKKIPTPTEADAPRTTSLRMASC